MPVLGSEIRKIRKISDEIQSSGIVGDESTIQNKLFWFLVEQYCAGTSEGLNAYTIAIDALGKSESFDPSKDSAVRTEMFKLRKSLETFFSGKPPNSPVLSIPKGTYSIHLSNAESGNAVQIFFRKYGYWILGGSFILVAVFAVAMLINGSFNNRDKVDCSEELPNLSTQVIGEYNQELAEAVSVLIKALLEQYEVFNIASDQVICSSKTPHIQLEILVSDDGRSKLLSLKAKDKRNNKPLVSNTFPLKLDQQTNISINIFKRDMADWVLTYGRLAREAIELNWDSPDAKRNLQCVLMQYDSYISDSFAPHEEAVECMEDAVKAGTASSSVYGFLVYNYLRQYVGHQKPTIGDPYGRAEELLKVIEDRGMKSAHSDHALVYYQIWRNDSSRAEIAYAFYIFESHYPDNTLALIDLARIAGYNLGDWEKAKKLSDQVLATHKLRDNSVTRIDATLAYLDIPNSEEKMRECAKMYSESHAVANTIILACALDTGDQEWIDKTTSNLNRLGYPNWEKLSKSIEREHYHPSFEKRLRQSYSKWKMR